MNYKTASPTTRLHNFQIGDKVNLPNDKRDFVIRDILENGYYELSHRVTAASCHQCEARK